MATGALSLLCLVGGAALVLTAVVGIVLIALSGRSERRNEIVLIVLGGLLLLACVCVAALMAWTIVPRVNLPATAPTPTMAAIPTRTLIPTRTPTPSPTPTPRPFPTPTTEPTNQPTIQPTTQPTLSHPVDVFFYADSLLPDARADAAALDDPPIYDIEAVVNWGTHTVIGDESVLVTNNEGVPLDALYFRLYPNAETYAEGRIEVGEITLDMQVLEARVDETVLEIRLPQPLAPEEQIELIIPFTVTVPHRPDRFGYDDDVMMLGHWYPTLAVYDDEGWNLDPYVEMGDAFYSEAGFYRVYVTVPEGVIVASTGIRIRGMTVSGDEARFTLISGATRDFALALSPKYGTVTRQVGETQVTSYYLEGNENGGEQALNVAADAIRAFNERFGPYPYTEFDVAETPLLFDGSPGGMEFPGIVFISTDLYDSERFYSEELDVIVAHETAHQWWYGVVGNNQVDDPWLDEAFASYSEILYLEETQGKGAAQAAEMLWIDLSYLLVATTGEDRPVATSLLEFDDELTYSGIVYSKGALFLRELRQLVGDETFFAILQHHYQTYRYGIVPPDGFRRSVAAVTSNDPDALALYDLWILSGETPIDLDNLLE